jgi:hypothetical protein
MDEERIKQAVLTAIERTDFAGALASAVNASLEAPGAGSPAVTATTTPAAGLTAGTQKLLTRIVLGDILDDSILGARPQDRTFPLRLFFSELGTLLAHEGEEGSAAPEAELAFTLASGLNFFFRAAMDPEAKIRVGLEVSRQLYSLAYDSHVKMDPDLVAKAAPLLATIMSSELERVRFESIDHTKVYDSQIHERTGTSDPTGSRILRPASFLCRVQTNNAVKAKAQVVT